MFDNPRNLSEGNALHYHVDMKRVWPDGHESTDYRMQVPNAGAAMAMAEAYATFAVSLMRAYGTGGEGAVIETDVTKFPSNGWEDGTEYEIIVRHPAGDGRDFVANVRACDGHLADELIVAILDIAMAGEAELTREQKKEILGRLADKTIPKFDDESCTSVN